MKNIRGEFGIFKHQPDLVYLDSAATALKPKAVIDATRGYYEEYSSNIHRGLYGLAVRADAQYERVRKITADFLGAESEKEIVFTSGTTGGINMLADILRIRVRAKDEIVVGEMEHHSNLLPWMQLAEEHGAKLKYIDVNEQGEWVKDWEKVFSRKTKIVAVSLVGNVTGVINDIKGLAQIAKKISADCVVVVDAAQAVPHIKVNVRDLGCDFLVFSGHKLYGPTGVGVLWGRRELLEELRPTKWGGGMVVGVTKESAKELLSPWKYEAGTPNVAGVIGMGAAIEWIQNVKGKMYNLEFQEKKLLEYLLGGLGKLKGIEVYGRTIKNRVGVVAFNVKGVHPHDVAQILSDDNICVRAGHHCAILLHERLGIKGSVRVSLGIYNNKKDIDKLMAGLTRVERKFGKG